MQEILSSSPSLLGSSTPIDKDIKIDSTTPNYYYTQNDFYYQNQAVAAVLHQHYQNYSNSNFSVNNLVDNQDQSVLVNHLHKPLNLNWQSTPTMSKNSSPNTNPTNTSSSSDSDYYNVYQDQDIKPVITSDNTVTSSNDFYQQKNIFPNNGFRSYQPQGNFYPYDQYTQRPYPSMTYYSSPKYEDLDAKDSKIVASSPKIEGTINSQVLSSSSSSSFTSSPNSNKNMSAPSNGSQGQNTSPNQNVTPESFDWMKPVKSAPNGKTRTKDKYRVVYSEPQRVELEKEFLFSKYITIKRKAELSQVLSLSERQIKIWFQNRRAKERKSNRKKKNGHAQQENVSSTTKNLKNDYSDDEMEDEMDESIDDEDSNEAKSDKKSKTQKPQTNQCPKTYPTYQPTQSFNQYPQPTVYSNQYSPVNTYQNFYQTGYPSYQTNFQNVEYTNFMQQPATTTQDNYNAQQNFQFQTNDYMINRNVSSASSTTSQQQQVNSSNSIIQVLSQFQSI